MTDLITEARELCEKATPGKWHWEGKLLLTDAEQFLVLKPYYDDDTDNVSTCVMPYDAAFIARSRTLVPELCDALEKAQTENKARAECNRKLAEQNRRLIWRNWIPVTERLPDGQQDVLIWFDRCGGDIGIGYRSKDKDAWFRCGIMICYNVTHWMPLPAPPEEGEQP